MTTARTSTAWQPSGMPAFITIWLGQFVSYIGTGMTRFAVTVWAYQTTGSAETLALVGFFSFAPILVMTPIAGALVDRWNRKLVMILADLGAALATLVVAVLYYTGNLEVWHLMVVGVLAGLFESFQFPAFSSSIATMLKKEQYTRANGMMSLAEWSSRIVSPVLAGLLLATGGLGIIMLVDAATCIVAIATVLLAVIPQPVRTAESTATRSTLLQDSLYGFGYIWQRAGLLGIAMLFFFANFLGDLTYILLAPLLLARTGDNVTILGTVQSAMGVGGVVGGLLLSIWGGPKRRIHAVLLGFIGTSLLGIMVIGAGTTLAGWIIGGFLMMIFFPITGGSSQAIWQSKVAPEVQGRVFAARRLIAQVSAPLGMLSGGVLADRVFEPMMRDSTSPVAALFAPLVGTAPGAGISLIFVIAGILGALVGVAGYLIPAIRNVEDVLPDYAPSWHAPVAAQVATDALSESPAAAGSD